MSPFTIHVPDLILGDLSSRLSRTRWPDEIPGAGWDYGTNLDYLKELVSYWRSEFDWRARERALNALPQFRVTVEGLGIHFVHVKGNGPDPHPLIITHGWPSSFAEMYGIVGPLADPARHGGDPADAFDVVIPSLPGFGFSDALRSRSGPSVDSIWRRLMSDVLGYRRFGAHGVDIGARVTSALGRNHSDVLSGIHIATVDLDWPDPMPQPDSITEEERIYLGNVERWEKEEGAYIEIQATRPQTVSYGLNDSPAGTAAWIVEKFRAWSDCGGDVESRFAKDDLLTTVMLYWCTETINSSMRRYYETRHFPPPRKTRIDVPTGIAMFPGEKLLVVPRSWAERAYNVTHWTAMPSGGHFPALEEPAALVADLRTFFRTRRR